MRRQLRIIGPLLALASAAYGVGCALSARDAARSSDAVETAACQVDLSNLQAVAAQFADLPDANANPTFYVSAARLAQLQSDLKVYESVARRFERIAAAPNAGAALSMTSDTAATEAGFSRQQVKRTKDAIEALLADAEARGDHLRGDDGAPIEARRAMEALFWRETAVDAAAKTAACASADDRPAVRDYANNVGIITGMDAHDLVLHTQIQKVLGSGEAL
jgi:hypothetical protein